MDIFLVVLVFLLPLLAVGAFGLKRRMLQDAIMRELGGAMSEDDSAFVALLSGLAAMNSESRELLFSTSGSPIKGSIHKGKIGP